MANLTPEQIQSIQAAVAESLSNEVQNKTIDAQNVQNIVAAIPTLVTGLITGSVTGVLLLAGGLSNVVINLINAITAPAAATQVVESIKQQMNQIK